MKIKPVEDAIDTNRITLRRRFLIVDLCVSVSCT